MLTLKDRVTSPLYPSLADVGESPSLLLAELRHILQMWVEYSDKLAVAADLRGMYHQ